MKILITRPESDAKELAGLLTDIGIGHITFPLLEIVPKNFSLENLSAYKGVLVTSSNAIKSLSKSSEIEVLRALPLYAVGNASFKSARENGFTRVFSANGDLPALERLVLEKTNPHDGPLLYLSGDVISGDLQGLLTQKGYEVDRVELYFAKKANMFSSSVIGAFADGDIDGVVLYSKRTAQIFTKLFTASGVSLAHTCKVFCLSQPVASKFCTCLGGPPEQFEFEIKTCTRPNQEDMLKLIFENMD